MKSIKQRIVALEKKLNPLVQIRKDLKLVNDVMKVINYNNRWNNGEPGNEVFFSGTKKEAVDQGINIIKCLIIDLASEYSKDNQLMKWKETNKGEQL